MTAWMSERASRSERDCLLSSEYRFSAEREEGRDWAEARERE